MLERSKTVGVGACTLIGARKDYVFSNTLLKLLSLLSRDPRLSVLC